MDQVTDSHFIGSAVLNILPPGNGPDDYPVFSRMRPLFVQWRATGEVQVYKRRSSPLQVECLHGSDQLVAQNGDLLELSVRKPRHNAENCESEKVFVVAKKWNSASPKPPIVGCVWDSETMAGEHFTVASVNEALRSLIEMPQVGYRLTICRQNMALVGGPQDIGSSDELSWIRCRYNTMASVPCIINFFSNESRPVQLDNIYSCIHRLPCSSLSFIQPEYVHY